MKKHYIIGLLLLSFLCFNTTAQAGFIKDIKVGKYQTWVDDMTAAAESNTGDRGNMYQNAFHRGWPACAVQNSGWYLGTTNWTAEDVDVQVAGLVNVAKNVDVLQLGLINVADSVSGVSFGLLNLIKKGYNKIEISTGDALYGNLAVKLGTRNFYNIFQVGTNFKKNVLGNGIIGRSVGSDLAHPCGLLCGPPLRGLRRRMNPDGFASTQPKNAEGPPKGGPSLFGGGGDNHIAF